MKILIIDDDKELSTIFETTLTAGGFQVVAAYDGNSGLDKAKTEKPDMILLDQVLPDRKGNDILKALKQDDETKHIPVSMLSNFGQNELIQDAMNSGAVDYILKYQVEPDDLKNKVNQLLKEIETKKAQ